MSRCKYYEIFFPFLLSKHRQWKKNIYQEKYTCIFAGLFKLRVRFLLSLDGWARSLAQDSDRAFRG